MGLKVFLVVCLLVTLASATMIEICICPPRKCFNVNLCPNLCYGGREVDVNGCLTCMCKQRPPCAVPRCLNHCKKYAKNERGCTTCRCAY